MVVYNFKKITPIPNATEMVDIILTRTQRKTPTVIHPGYKITRIRSFYMRKVKFTQQTVDEKLAAMLQEFPRLDDIHPFYSDLMNILYDRDHYKLALGQINTAKNLVSGISKDYLRLMKYGDSLYRCKQLKRAALGRMCTVIKKLKAALGYLEEVRKHISRLPALDPSTRTLLLTGYPNVGKSSFMNKITRAEVDVQPYAFTTKALFVGHMDHRYLRWQVVDTPGILDRPLEERNTIEMQAITALAHLQCAVLYFLDISEQCGYSLDQQIKLFLSIQPLFAHKQVILVANKIDVLPYDQLPAHQRQLIEETAKAVGAELVPMSNVSEENISRLKTLACDRLLEARVDAKLSAGRVKDYIMGRITVVQPKPRDNRLREACIPDSVLLQQQQQQEHMLTDDDHDDNGGSNNRNAFKLPSSSTSSQRQTEKDLMWAQGGPGVYACDYRKYYLLEEDEWKFDAIPTIMDGKNVLDYFDEDIETKLRELEEEETELERSGAYDVAGDDDDDIDEEEQQLFEAIKAKQIIARKLSRETKPKMPHKVLLKTQHVADIKESLEAKGLPSEGLIKSITRGRSSSRNRQSTGDIDDDENKKPAVAAEFERGRKRTRSNPDEQQQKRGGVNKMDIDDTLPPGSAAAVSADGRSRSRAESRDGLRIDSSSKRARSKSVKAQFKVRTKSSTRGTKEGSVAPAQMSQVDKSKRSMERGIIKFARAGEADRRHYPKLVKHLNSGKRSLGTSTIGR